MLLNRSIRWLTLALTALPIGCHPFQGDRPVLVVVSPWPVAQRRDVERAFSHWLANGHVEFARIEWLVLGPNDDLERVVLARRTGTNWTRSPLDCALGGPASRYERLSRLGQLIPSDSPESGRPAWRVVRRSALGRAVSDRPGAEGRSSGEAPPRVAFDDPRHDPIALEWAKHRLRGGPWAERYAQLVKDLADSPRAGRQTGVGLADVERGAADEAPAVEPQGQAARGIHFVSSDDDEWREGAAILRGGRHPALAERFLEFLAETGTTPIDVASAPDDHASDELLADLLGATLVDAQDELWEAWAALRRANRPARAEAFLTESPPWPPASVEKLLDENSGELFDALAGQVAPDADVRAWLMRSWLAPGRRVDGALLDELAGALDGRLAREPRFRAWLRAEWTAWARQRYRRVARVAAGRWP